MKTKIKKIPISPLIDILLTLEKEGIEFVDIEVTSVSPDLDKIKIIAKDYYMSSQESPEMKIDENNINDIIAWQ